MHQSSNEKGGGERTGAAVLLVEGGDVVGVVTLGGKGRSLLRGEVRDLGPPEVALHRGRQ